MFRWFSEAVKSQRTMVTQLNPYASCREATWFAR